MSFSQTEYVAYGEVTFQESDLEIDNYDLVGPGINVDEVHVDITNPTSSDIDANVSAFLMDSGSEVESGSSVETFSSGQTETVVISIDRARMDEFDSVDITLQDSSQNATTSGDVSPWDYLYGYIIAGIK